MTVEPAPVVVYARLRSLSERDGRVRLLFEDPGGVTAVYWQDIGDPCPGVGQRLCVEVGERGRPRSWRPTKTRTRRRPPDSPIGRTAFASAGADPPSPRCKDVPTPGRCDQKAKRKPIASTDGHVRGRIDLVPRGPTRKARGAAALRKVRPQSGSRVPRAWPGTPGIEDREGPAVRKQRGLLRGWSHAGNPSPAKYAYRDLPNTDRSERAPGGQGPGFSVSGRGARRGQVRSSSSIGSSAVRQASMPPSSRPARLSCPTLSA
jgi:hypothetical protein